MAEKTLHDALAAQNLVLSAQAAVLGAGEAPPEWIEILPAGQINGVDGRGPWFNKNPAQIIANTRQGVWPKHIDYNHQSVYACLQGGEAPAAAWISDLQDRNGAVWAKVEWTSRGAQSVAAREYRFISPAMQHDQKTGEVMAIHSVGLVNTPNIAELPAIASQVGAKNPMDELLKALRQALGLPDDADKDAILAACKKNRGNTTSAASALAPLASNLKLAEGTSVEDIVVAACSALAATGTPDPSQFVPMSMFVEMRNKVSILETNSAKDKAETTVADAMAAGKVTPAQKDWALAYASQDPAGFKSFVEKTAPIVSPGTSGLQGVPGAQLGTADDATVLEVCSTLGVSVEAYRKTEAALKKEAK